MAKILTDQNYLDDVQAKFGTSGDLQIHHDGSNSYVSDVGTGSLILTGTDLQLKSAGDEYFMYGAADGQVSLYHNGIKKFETSSTGVSVTGGGNFSGTSTATSFVSSTDSGININGLTMTRVAANSAIRTSDGLETLGLLRSYAGLNVATTGTFGGLISAGAGINVTGNIDTPELSINDYVKHNGDTNTYFGFNANNQFSVFCGGTRLNVTSTQINTYSAEITTSGSPQYFTYGGSGSQQLVFRENGPGGYKNSIIASAGGGVQLFYNNTEKLVTQSGGVSLGNNSLYLGQYSGIYLNGVGPSAGKVIAGTGSSSQLIWVDSVSNITVGTGLDISSSTSSGAITKNITLDFNELPVIDGDDPQADWFIVESSEDENSKINYSDLQNVDAHWKTFQTVITSNFDDRSSSTSIFYMPLNYISEVTSANYYNTFACPRGGTVKRIMMMHTAGSTMSTSFTTELSILKNGLSTSFSGELTPSNSSNDGSNITWSPNYTFTAGDRLNFRYQKSGTGKYWYGVSVSIIIEFDTI